MEVAFWLVVFLLVYGLAAWGLWVHLQRTVGRISRALGRERCVAWGFPPDCLESQAGSRT